MIRKNTNQFQFYYKYVRVCSTHTHSSSSLVQYRGSTVLIAVLKLMNMHIAYVQVYVRVCDQCLSISIMLSTTTPLVVFPYLLCETVFHISDRQDWDHTGAQLVNHMMQAGPSSSGIISTSTIRGGIMVLLLVVGETALVEMALVSVSMVAISEDSLDE